MIATVSTAGARPLFPFSAILGQERMKLALLLLAIDPGIGGVLMRGEKGTAKSTAARALARVLAAIDGEARLVTLPLNATEEMVVGGLDFSATMAHGQRVFQPGVLARAHGGVLYIDEVNLLDDRLVDLILDATESGVNLVEREGISFQHDCRFALIGTMNPEEGALRPQLLDRFGLCVEVASERDPELRVALLERREAYERDPHAFAQAYAVDESALSARLARARNAYQGLRLPVPLRNYISELAMSRYVAGHRADLVIARAAIAHAAWQGHDTVTVDDVFAVAEMALLHRQRDTLPPPPPSASPPPPPGEDDTAGSSAPPPPSLPENTASTMPPPSNQDGADHAPPSPPPAGDAGDQLYAIGDTFRVKRITPVEDRVKRRGAGRRTRTRTSEKQGRYVRSRPRAACRDLALDATLRAAAPHQRHRRASSQAAVVIRREDWQEKVREKRIGSFILFVVDASGSMGARGRMVASKGAVMSLLLDAYQQRDKVAMITFRRHDATLALPPTASIDVAGKLLRELPVGGRTPLAAGLVKAYEMLAPALRRDPTLRPLVVLVSDGKANVGIDGGNGVKDACRLAERLAQDTRIRWVVVDTEAPHGVRLHLAHRLAVALGAAYFHLEDLQAHDLVQVVKGQH